MKNLKKELFNKLKSYDFVQWIMAGVLYLAIRMMWALSKKDLRGSEYIKEFSNKPAIFVFWHGRTMMLSPLVSRFKVRGYAVASKHADGRMMAKLQRLFGLRSILGSTTSGAVAVLQKGMRVMKKGHPLCISPDGPKGPLMRLSQGCVYFARMSGAPIIPVTYSATKAVSLRSWDKYMIVKPFGKVICSVGEPMYYNRKNPNEMEDMQKRVEDYLVAELHALDKEAGLPFVIEQGAERIK